ncbi:hypothetical protein HYU19_05935 [Candidatus Woesearchaeota archaeon]|nr:hypothetical protein [Candidatus Woesearchaeota archaeon]
MAFAKGTLYVNKERTKELDAEGYAREVMRRVQSLRKKAGLQKADRILLHLQSDEEGVECLQAWQEQIKEKVGAQQLVLSPLPIEKEYQHTDKLSVRGLDFVIGMDKG